MKNVIIASTCCLCYGAENAIAKTLKALEDGEKVAMLKVILHNKNVMQKLLSMGARVIENVTECKEDDCVIICAHGEKKSTFDYLNELKINYIDCTCPNVKAIEKLVEMKNNEGYKIIIIGKHGFDGKPIHAEVKGTMGWCDDPIVIEDESEISNIDLSFEKYYLVVQTTFARDKAEKFINIIQEIMKSKHKMFEYKNTICDAQKQINLASVELAKDVDVMVVVGGKNSNNSKELFNNVSQYVPALFIENEIELKKHIINGFFNKYNTIGITAGASTMKQDIEKMKLILETL